jgi:alpha-D-xyloside xylohydrolase
MGGFLQYATEKLADVIELRIYPGADGKFVLYEDENDTYNYEKGQFATIEFQWNDKAKTLKIGEHKGTFKGMLTERKFNVVIVKANVGTGVEISTQINKTVNYSGNKVEVKL